MRAGERESQIIGVNSSNADPTLTLLGNQTDNLVAITGISEPVIIAPTFPSPGLWETYGNSDWHTASSFCRAGFSSLAYNRVAWSSFNSERDRHTSKVPVLFSSLGGELWGCGLPDLREKTQQQYSLTNT